MKINITKIKTLGTIFLVNFLLLGCEATDINTSSVVAGASSSMVVVQSSSIAASSSSRAASSSSAAPYIPPAPPKVMKLVYAVNIGATTDAVLNGVTYKGENRFITGGTVNVTTDVIAGVAEPKLYQSQLFGTMTIAVPLTNGKYKVVLHHAELWWEEIGKRSFNVDVEGKRILSQIDLYSLVGHDGAFDYVEENVMVADGALTVQLTTLVDNATISGLAIYSEDGGALVASTPTPTPQLNSIASTLDKLFLDVPCASNTPTPLANGATCVHASDKKRLEKSVKLAGDPLMNYKVTLRVRGIWEPTNIMGGQSPLAGKPFTIGGTLVAGNGTSGDTVNYQQYSIDVAKPKQVYWLNNHKRTGHEIYKADYEADFIIAGGTDVKIVMYDGNERQIANFTKDFFNDVPPYNTTPSAGQSVRLDVIKVELAP